MKFKNYILSIFVISLSSCYYDSEEKLYPNPPACDTIDVSYSNKLEPLFIAKCYSCHDDRRLGSVYDFQGYSDLLAFVDGHNMLGAIKHEAGVPAMPQGADKLTDCEINFVESWINQGKKNN